MTRLSTTIHTLPTVRSGASSPGEGSSSIRNEIELALKGTEKPTIPGSREEDKEWAFKRSVPTLVLYDEQGLRLYDQITAKASEYYLFPDELNLLKEHGSEIARAMGFPGKQFQQDEKEEEKQERAPLDDEFAPSKPWSPAKWGDAALGKWNGGVNGEEGLGGGWERGYDVVELGAGALRKTAHLLTALSSALPNPPSNADSLPPPITFHPLDLSRPELHRVLGEMDEAFGAQLKGKVACVGLHGDYEAGLKFIREGKLGTLRQASTGESNKFLRGRGLQLANVGSEVREESLSSKGSSQAVPQIPNVKATSESPSLSPSSAHILTPGSETSALPSALAESEISDIGCGNGDSPGTWSPIEDEQSPPMRILSKNPGQASSGADNPSRPLHMVFLGSSLGNFSREAAAPFLKSLPLRPGDTLLLGLDGRPSPGEEGSEKVRIAYNDPSGHTRAFEEHGWDVVRQELGVKDDAGVEFVGRYNEVLGRHEAYFRSKEHQTIHLPNLDEDVTLEKNELLNIEWSYKYSLLEMMNLFTLSDLRVINSWKAPDSEYRLWVLERPHVRFIAPPSAEMTVLTSSSAPHEEGNKLDKKGVPKWEEWLALWKFWDHITLEMIPEKMLHQKPIDLRHICLFYLGHIPTFLDIHLTRMTKGFHTEPEYFKTIFERGIDPDVDDPTKCHDHSEVPMSEADWPALDEILGFRDRVRARLRGIYDRIATGQMELSRHVGRVLFMTYEHEAMHAETLLYMLAQSFLTRPPTAVAAPQWDVLAEQWAQEARNKKVLYVDGGEVAMGHSDFEDDDKNSTKGSEWKDHEFGWDIEAPKLSVGVKPFKVDSLTITNHDYLSYLKATSQLDSLDQKTAPASWVRNDQMAGWAIRTLYGPLPFEVAGDWTLMASKLEIEGYASWKGGRLPTEAELRKLWQHPDGPRPAGQGANVGVKNWHPVAPAPTLTDNAGNIVHGHNGGVWEWTDTELKGYEGYVPSELYPGYSADFFDGKHYVVLGGSFATVPRIAERQSFRNWYQANYKFSFIGGRVAYDVTMRNDDSLYKKRQLEVAAETPFNREIL